MGGCDLSIGAHVGLTAQKQAHTLHTHDPAHIHIVVQYILRAPPKEGKKKQEYNILYNSLSYTHSHARKLCAKNRAWRGIH